MKKLKKAVTLLAALTMSVSAFVACDGGNGGNGGNQGNPNEVQIYYWNSGYKLEFMKKIVDDFNAQQSTYKAILDSDQNASTIIRSLDLGNANPYDLYFTMLNTNQYNKQFIKLDDVLDSKADGENVTIREKYYDYLLNGVKNTDGTTNFLTYGNGWCSIVYDADVIDGVKYKVPNTTDELETLVTALEGDDKKAWLFYNDQYNNGYLNYALFGWEAQYDGIDYYNNNMLALKDANGKSPSKEVFLAKDGRYEALKVFEKVITPYNSHNDCTSTSFTKVQTQYLKGEAVLTINGSWLMNESTGTKDNFVMMKLPVISSIVNKLEDKSMSDATLSKIVAEIDEGKESSELCSAGDYARIKEARNVMYNNAAEQYVFIPEYSNAKEGAKAFLKYFYSDKGTKTFMETVKLPSAVKLADESLFDAYKLSAWDKAQFAFSKELTAVTNTMTKSPVFTNASTTQLANLFFCQALIASNPNDYKGADALWDLLTGTINKNWDDWSKNA